MLSTLPNRYVGRAVAGSLLILLAPLLPQLRHYATLPVDARTLKLLALSLGFMGLALFLSYHKQAGLAGLKKELMMAGFIFLMLWF
jgi:hypothetical protein